MIDRNPDGTVGPHHTTDEGVELEPGHNARCELREARWRCWCEDCPWNATATTYDQAYGFIRDHEREVSDEGEAPGS